MVFISQEPTVCVVEDFLEATQCAALIECARPLVRASGTAFGGARAAQNVRTSSTVLLKRDRNEVAPLQERTARLLRKPVEHCEDPQVSRYLNGEFYLAHYDGPDVDEPTARPFLLCGGQRLATVLVYLNEVASGGATRFPLLNLEVQPKAGRALVFFPGRLDGTIDHSLVHEACPAIDTKWVAQIWVRHGIDLHGSFMRTVESR